MNKDVINISSEDDITDILARLKSSKQKIVAFVPPQPSTVFRSAVNIKLIKKTAEKSGKVPVIITTEPALLKLAMEHHLHVSDSLQSKPYIPQGEDIDSSAPVSQESVAEDFVKPSDAPVDYDREPSEEDLDVAAASTEEEKAEPEEKKKEGFLPWLKAHKILVIVASALLVLIVGFIVWASVFAQDVSVAVSVRTTEKDFSENVSFTKNMNEESSKTGVFYLQEETYKDEQKVDFTATGKKDAGDKAKGTLTVWSYLNADETITINANTQFSYGGQFYYSTADVSMTFDEEACENKNNTRELMKTGCLMSTSVEVIAAEPGEKYNLGANKSDWTSALDLIESVVNPEAIAGGTSKIVTVVSQSDIDGAIKKLGESISESDAKKKLYSKISDTTFPIEASYKKDEQGTKASVNAGDETDKGSVTRTVVYSIFVVDKVRLGEFISEKATLADDQKIYSTGDPFVEHFISSGDKYTAKLKTSFKFGPEITEESIMNKVSGRKIGEAQSQLKSIRGVSTVDISSPYFWVSSIPSDPNKIKIDLKVEE